MNQENNTLEVVGARVHNLKNISIKIPRDKLVVITGLSGSGKSSLAFDTIYAEGQRRYVESFASYARQFLGTLERPDVDKIDGLSPVISIEQKTVSKNPRSTVGTITEIYDFIRLLYSKVADAYSYVTGEKMVKYSEKEILNLVLKDYDQKAITILAPIVKGRKGHYRELFKNILKQGFLRVRVDGKIIEIDRSLQLDRYKVHDIEIVIDRLEVKLENKNRINDALTLAMKQAKGVLMILEKGKEAEEPRFFSKNLMCPSSGISYDPPAPNSFSFNSPYGACPKCNGLGEIAEISQEKIIPDPNLSIKKGGLAPLGEYENKWIFKQVEVILKHYGFTLTSPIKEIDETTINTILYGTNSSIKVTEKISGTSTTYSFSFEGVTNFISRHYEENQSKQIGKWAIQFMNKVTCGECHGSRLKKESLYFKIDNKNIGELANLDIEQLAEWFNHVESNLNKRNQLIAKDVLKEIRTRIQFLLDVGLTYLALNRSAASLSGGEAQRIRLATQIGSQLVGVLYILDEPSIGLHQRDNARLIEALQNLRDIGNSIIVVEHDKDIMLASDHLIDIGPFAGIHGGKIVNQGTPEEVMQGKSLTTDYLNGTKNIEIPKKRRVGNGKKLILKGATGNNLKNVTATFPLGKMICITGVSGSGKSSLIDNTLYPILNNHIYNGKRSPLPYQSIKGLEHIDKVIEIDQSPIGRTPRSNPATYTGVFTDIRMLFSNLQEAKIRGYKPGRFSFNVKGGRCETCKGAGVQTIEMNFLPDVYVECPECFGRRYNRETLEVRYKSKSISDVLNMTINQAVDFFEHIPSILLKIKTLQDVGLGYVHLGQASTTLSGGEAQRVKLASELAKKNTGNTFYILDEPTTGLHFEDIRVLLVVLNKLTDAGNTVLIIEHNLDIIKVADHIIDLGPEGGKNGGQIIAEGSPEKIIKSKKGFTSVYLKKEMTDDK
ncbi:MAG: excinuclease ABC subunit UvrA [Bacteroidetes bacterium]|nr:excinuclease ABC subunit UvrA [Bacteroidota bacterium]MCB0802510.1 excinuclease ABC subunit UvrA [Flavobacteriales bacterium]NOG58654.1 excinuclease ABC subunit UvrA [Bacteroidota bacterium]